jgi:serine/threonine protein kinase
MIGSAISHYEILEKLGEGGMGVVYKARDSRLKRFAALKVLPPEKVTDPERKQRFVQEARSASALNHPNIVTVYDIGQSDGVDFIAMEYVEGSTLDELIGRKGLKLNEALRCAIQIADALAKAHAAGIVHRDLKPGNVMVTPDGWVKVLDFGLAKLTEAAPASPEDPTLTAAPSTELGQIVGTAAYMSPEQAEGKKVDARSDIFSFGSVMYEMLSGRRAFRRDSSALTLAAILHLEPPPLPEGTPGELERIVTRCLRKDPARRFQTMADLKVMLQELKEESDSGKLAPAALSPKTRSRLWIAGLATFAILATIGAAAWMLRGRRTATPRPVEWQQLTNFTDSATQPSLSPDGRFLTFVRGPGTFFTQGQIYVKLLPDGEPVQLTRDGRTKMSPIFTPDGSRIAYTVALPWNTWIVPVLGGEPSLMLANASGLRWIGPDRLLFSEIKSGAHMALVTSRESRTDERDVYVPPHERGMAHRSALSPDGKWVLLAEMDNSGWLPCRLAPFDASSSGRRVGPQQGGCTDAAWSPDGKWMYLTSDSGGKFHIWRQRLDGGAPERITSGPNEEEGIAMAPDGRSLITSVGQIQSEIWFHDAAGERQVSSQGFARSPLLSVDEKRIYYLRTANELEGGELWVWERDSNRSERLLPGIVIKGFDSSFDISPDNKRLVYSVANPGLKSEIWLAALDGRFPPRRLSSGDDSAPRFVPDGDIVFSSSEGKTNYLYRMRGDGTGRQKLSEKPILSLDGISPDGKWANVWGTGPDEESPNTGLLVPTEGGASVRTCLNCSVKWAPDGKYFYIHLGDMSRGHGAPLPPSEGVDCTYAIPLRNGSMAPPLPPAGVDSVDDLKNVPGVRIIDAAIASPGMLPSTYAFTKTSVHRNLYRVPLP